MSGIPADVTEAAKAAYIEASRAKKKPLDPFDIVAAVERAILAERARAVGALLLLSSDEIRLHMGEVSAQEMRSIRAFAKWRAFAIREDHTT